MKALKQMFIMMMMMMTIQKKHLSLSEYVSFELI